MSKKTLFQKSILENPCNILNYKNESTFFDVHKECSNLNCVFAKRECIICPLTKAYACESFLFFQQNVLVKSGVWDLFKRRKLKSSKRKCSFACECEIQLFLLIESTISHGNSMRKKNRRKGGICVLKCVCFSLCLFISVQNWQTMKTVIFCVAAPM